MALLASSNSFSSAGNDLGRCGLPYNSHPGSFPEAEAKALASGRLLTAAANGEVAQAARCLADGADINFQDPSSGETALHRAAQRNHVQVLEMLLSAGADLNHRDRAQRTPLFVAAHVAHIPAIQLLLRHGAQLFPEPPCGSTTIDTIPVSCSPHPPAQDTDNGDAAFLALRSTCPLATAAAAGRWHVVSALLDAFPPDYHTLPAALCSLRFLVWALASHKAFPPDVISQLPRRLPPCVVDAVRPAYLASTPLVLATGNDQQQLMQWLLRQGADPELGAPLLLCAGRFCHGSRTCCVNTLLRRGARPHVAWADNPTDSPLLLAARGDCFTHVHCLVAYGADVDGEVARVRQVLYTPLPWEAHLDALLQQYGSILPGPGAAAEQLLCPCGLQHTSWPGLWPEGGEAAEGDDGAGGTGGGEGIEEPPAAAGAGGNSCNNKTPSDDAWYRHNLTLMEQLQDGTELTECRKAVDDLWLYGVSAVVSEIGGAPAAPHSLMPQRVLTAMQDVAGGWLLAALRCRQQRQLRMDLYDKAVAAGRALLDRKRVAALAALGGNGGRVAGACHTAGADREAGVAHGSNTDHGGHGSLRHQPELRDERDRREPPPQGAVGRGGDDVVAMTVQYPRPSRQALTAAAAGGEGLALELRMEILALAGLAPQAVEAWTCVPAARGPCTCVGCRT